MSGSNKWLVKWVTPGLVLLVIGIVLAAIGQTAAGTVVLLIGVVEAAIVYVIWQLFL